MKALAILPGSLALAALVLAAHAQVPTTSHDNPTPAKPPTKVAKGVVATKDGKTLGQKMVEKSKPLDSRRLRTPIQ